MTASSPKNSAFLWWASHTLIGHIVIFLAGFSVPGLALFLFLDYSDGRPFTVGRAMYLAFLCGIAGAVVATLGWYTISLPLMERREKERR